MAVVLRRALTTALVLVAIVTLAPAAPRGVEAHPVAGVRSFARCAGAGAACSLEAVHCCPGFGCHSGRCLTCAPAAARCQSSAACCGSLICLSNSCTLPPGH